MCRNHTGEFCIIGEISNKEFLVNFVHWHNLLWYCTFTLVPLNSSHQMSGYLFDMQKSPLVKYMRIILTCRMMYLFSPSVAVYALFTIRNWVSPGQACVIHTFQNIQGGWKKTYGYSLLIILPQNLNGITTGTT